MDLFTRRDSSSTSSSLSSNSKASSSEKENNENLIPAWKRPLTTALLNKAAGRSSSEDRSSKRDSVIPIQAAISPELAEDEATAQLIQILLPCIICNRTFSPEALERHSKICSQVNMKDPRRPARGKFNSAEQRIKHTKIEDFIPPPDDLSDDTPFIRKGSCRIHNREPFSRNSKSRSSLGATTTTTPTSSLIPTWRKRSVEPPKAAVEQPFENISEFGSEDSHDSFNKKPSPSYAQPLSPTGDCPFCGRNFNIKAYDRHVKFCQELHERKQYETQPVPKEKEEAMERQEIRTKYKPLKGSTSCGSLRSSVSPGRDFPSMMAMKFYGFMNKTFNKNFKKSNESLAASCYGDYARNLRRASPAPSVASSVRPVYQRANTTLSVSRGPMRVNTSSNIPKRTKSIEKMNVGSHLMAFQNNSGNSYGHGQTGNNGPAYPSTHYNHVPSSGYGQQYIQSGNFNRNAKSRSSVHKNFNFFSSKRVEPEGTENTSTTPSAMSTVGSPGELIITPMSLYSKGKVPLLTEQERRQNKNNILHHGNAAEEYRKDTGMNEHAYRRPEQYRHKPLVNEEEYRKPGILNSDPTYDPYEKAARQFEELLKTQVKSENHGQQRSQSRKVGLDRALRSVTEPYGGGDNNAQENHVKAKEDDPFVFNLNDDSYWDGILNHNNKSKAADDDMTETNDEKSRAVSNISSADSAFSRSDGADMEFEALESLVNNREPTPPVRQNRKSDVPSPTAIFTTSTPSPRESPAQSSFSSPLSSYQPRLQEKQTFTEPAPSTPPVANMQSESAYDNRPSPPVETTTPTPAKFCHECGMLYPTSSAKFCPECGERRILK